MATKKQILDGWDVYIVDAHRLSKITDGTVENALDRVVVSGNAHLFALPAGSDVNDFEILHWSRSEFKHTHRNNTSKNQATSGKSENIPEPNFYGYATTTELFMLYCQGCYSKTLLCHEHAIELAEFIRDSTGLEVGIKKVKIGFHICHSTDFAEGSIDDDYAHDPVIVCSR